MTDDGSLTQRLKRRVRKLFRTGPPASETLEEHFRSMFLWETIEHDNGCITLRGQPNGYANLRFRGVMWRVTELVMWFMNGQEQPAKSTVMHSCDNPPCINPEHLTIGSYTQNSIDARTKERIGKLKLSEVHEIRTAYQFGAHPQVLADLYGVNKHTVNFIIRGGSHVA